MRNNLRLYHKVFQQIHQWLKAERVARQRNLALLVVGLYLTQSVYLSKIGSKLPIAAKKLSLADRLRRFLSNTAVQVEAYYEPLLVPLLRGLADKEVVLIMDTTQVGPWHRALVLSLPYRDRALPLAWSVYEGTRGNVAATAQIALLERVYQLLPLVSSVTLLGDSGFDSTDLLLWLRAHEWHFVIRQKRRATVRPLHEDAWFALREVELQEGETKSLGWVYLAKSSPFGPVWVVLHWKQREDEPWLLVSDYGHTRLLLRLYRKRARIEAMYSDMKSRGFDLQKTRLRSPQRIARLMLAIAILYLWFVALGSWVVKNGLRRQIDRPDRRDLSYFRLGWDRLGRPLAPWSLLSTSLLTLLFMKVYGREDTILFYKNPWSVLFSAYTLRIAETVHFLFTSGPLVIYLSRCRCRTFSGKKEKGPMAKPAIVIADDEPHVLSVVERDLRQHYRNEYRLIKAQGAKEALAAAHRLKRRNTPVALFLVDQRMPEMNGTELLLQTQKLYPEARKVLLTAYADTEAAIASINEVGLDHYLMKPWDPPEQHLYPILDDLLSDWWARATIPYDGIRVAGTLWSGKSHDVKEFLARNRIPYQWLDIEKDADALALVEGVENEHNLLPVVFFPDGHVLIAPDYPALARKVGLRTEASASYYDFIIVGAGPAGLGAAVYGASEGFKTLLVDKYATGGQAGSSSRIENYLGFPKGISGTDLASRATAQAMRLGAEILTAQEAVSIRVEDSYRLVALSDGSELTCRALLLATGVTVRQLDAPGIQKLTGAGAYYGAAVSEAAHYEGERVYIVGGANSAGQGAMFLSRYAARVTMLVRGSSLRRGMSRYLIDQIEATENIDVCTKTVVVAAHGDQKLEALTICDLRTEETRVVPAAALFLFIGAEPHTEMVAGLLERNNAGFIVTGPDLMRDGSRPQGWKLKRDPYLLETSVPGIFAAGDVRHGAVRRVASAVGQGAIVVNLVHQYLKSV